jgi:Ca-activated chloride channel family protein
LESTEVEMDITGGINAVTVTQTYVNHTPEILEAVYTFPLPARAAVTDLELRVEDRVIRSVVQEREQAKKTYEAAKVEGKKTALLEQQRPNLFATSVANLGPGERVTIRFEYVEPLPYRKGEMSVTFPMVVGQRYLPPEWQQQEDGSFILQPVDQEDLKLNPPLLPLSFPEQANLSLRASIQGIPVSGFESTTHAIHVKEPATEQDPFVVTLARGQVVPNAEFNLTIRLSDSSRPEATFVESVEGEEHFGLLTLFPPTRERKTKKAPPRDVVFLIDTSGSMSGDSIGQARAGLEKCLEMLRPGDRFNIIRFADTYSSFAPDFRPATAEKRDEALSYIRNLDSGGGTEMQPALRHALSLPANPGHLKLVIFLTDGNVGNEDDLMRLLESELGRTRLFTFAIGSAPNEYLVRTMAEQGRGQARFIRSHEDIGHEMTDFFRTLEAPVLTDITLTWLDAQGNERQLQGMFPRPCPDVFLHRPVQVVVSSREPLTGQVVVQGTVEGQTVSTPFDIQPADRQHPAVSRMYGRAVIQDLMLDYLRADTPVLQNDIREAVIQTALTHQLVTKFTSRVAVEERVTVAPDGSRNTVQVKVPLPRGWSGAGFHATATLDPLLMLIGGQLLLISLLFHVYRKRALS